MKSHQMLTACRVKSARAPKPKTEKKPTPAPAPEQKPDPQPKPKAEKKPVPAPQETKPAPVKEISPAPVPAPVPPASPAPSPLSPAEISAAAVKSSIPSANVEIKGAKTSCPIVWAYDVPKQDEEKIKSLGFLWANKRQGWWKKPGAADAQATA